MNPQPTSSPKAHTLYVPGYSLPKLGLSLLGVVLLTLGLITFWPFLKLAIAGQGIRAETARVIVVDANGAERILKTEAEVDATIKTAEEERDRTSVFYSEYRFVTKDAKTVEVRSPIGYRVNLVGEKPKSRQLIRDADGLPRLEYLWYDPAHPTTIILPTALSTYFMPGMLILFGFIAFGLGLLLWWYSKRPIEVPDLSHAHGEDETKRLPTAGH